jgi:lysozyme family protein
MNFNSAIWRSFLALALLTSCQKKPEGLVVSPTATGRIKIQGDRWNAAKIRPEKVHFVQAVAAQITRNRSRYESVSRDTKVPWQVIGVIHSLEADLSFRCNLGQGDTLTAQSRHVPKGRPPIPPNPPFTWEYAAEDSLRFDHLDRESWADIGNELQNVEAYNGLGYQKYHPNVPSPYLWGWSTIQKPGKYVADGKWSSTATSAQCGAAMILKLIQ